MRIAFTSCFSAVLYPEQPVWREIAAARPDAVVLMGDSIYLDNSGGLTPEGLPLDKFGLARLSAYDFARHGHGLYQRQLAQPDFRALLATGVPVHAMWDDHDFLWDGACGANAMANPAQQGHVQASNALFAAWQDALLGKPFPAQPPTFGPATKPPGYRHVDLGGGVHLHLTDGRSWRRQRWGGNELLGQQQLKDVAKAMKDAGPGATHLLASSTTVTRGESWRSWAKPEYDHLLQLARDYNIVVLSGDIHEADIQDHPLGGGRHLYEAIASGAALKKGVILGGKRRNWGLLSITPAQVDVRVHSMGAPGPSRVIDRATWSAIA